MFGKLFGGKSWYKSMTAWAALIFLVAQTAIPAAGDLGIIDFMLSETLMDWMTKGSALLGGLGIRKAASAPNVA